MTEERWKRLLQALGALFLLLFALGPFVYMALVSVSRRADFLRPSSAFHFTTAHFRTVLTDPALHLPAYLRNSLVVAGVSAAAGVVLALLAAYGFTRLPARGKPPLLFVILAASLFPQISLASALFKTMTRLGWINTYPALLMPDIAWTLPLALWILVSAFSQIPRDLDKAAVLDGCTHAQVLWKIVVPLAAPAVVAAGLLSFIFVFNEFLFALLLTTDAHARTMPVAIAFFQGAHGETPWGEIMAAAVLTALPVVGLALVFQRRIIQGLTRGAVKG